MVSGLKRVMNGGGGGRERGEVGGGGGGRGKGRLTRAERAYSKILYCC